MTNPTEPAEQGKPQVWVGHCPACCPHCLHNEYIKHICGIEETI